MSRYKKGTRTREPLRPCTDLKADEKVRATAKVKNDRKSIVIAVDELKAKHAKYHPQCYKDYTRPQKKSKEGSDDLKTDIIIKVANDLLSSALVVFYKNFKLECVKKLNDNGYDVSRDLSFSKNLRRSVERNFAHIKFLILKFFIERV